MKVEVELTDREYQVLQELCIQKDLSRSALLRQALRLYQLVDIKTSRGDRLFVDDVDLRMSMKYEGSHSG